MKEELLLDIKSKKDKERGGEKKKERKNQGKENPRMNQRSFCSQNLEQVENFYSILLKKEKEKEESEKKERRRKGEGEGEGEGEGKGLPCCSVETSSMGGASDKEVSIF